MDFVKNILLHYIQGKTHCCCALVPFGALTPSYQFWQRWSRLQHFNIWSAGGYGVTFTRFYMVKLLSSYIGWFISPIQNKYALGCFDSGMPLTGALETPAKTFPGTWIPYRTYPSKQNAFDSSSNEQGPPDKTDRGCTENDIWTVREKRGMPHSVYCEEYCGVFYCPID